MRHTPNAIAAATAASNIRANGTATPAAIKPMSLPPPPPLSIRVVPFVGEWDGVWVGVGVADTLEGDTDGVIVVLGVVDMVDVTEGVVDIVGEIEGVGVIEGVIEGVIDGDGVTVGGTKHVKSGNVLISRADELGSDWVTLISASRDTRAMLLRTASWAVAGVK